MVKSSPLVLALLLAACAHNPTELPPRAGALTTEPYVFGSNADDQVQAEHGWFQVPENRSDPSSR